MFRLIYTRKKFQVISYYLLNVNISITNFLNNNPDNV